MTAQADVTADPAYRALLDHGFVGIVDTMGDDAAIVQAARVSYGKGTRAASDDRGLIRYLMRHEHLSPLEMAVVKLHVKAPIFVARQWMRHRTFAFNECSARYSEMADECYVPESGQIQAQAADNKQGRAGPVERSWVARCLVQDANKDALDAYEGLLQLGVARELARVVMPVGSYTEFFCQANLRNLLHFLHLRADAHAQYEIRVYAEAIIALIAPLFPLTFEAWEDYVRGGYRLSRMEVEAVRVMIRGGVTGFDDMGARETKEFMARFCS